jgi:hypothetical protein
MPANGAWEDGLVHVAHVTAHCVGVCCHTLVLFTWASTCHAGVVVVLQFSKHYRVILPITITYSVALSRYSHGFYHF